MRIEIKRPHPGFPLAWVFASVPYKSVDSEKFGFDASMMLIKRNITIIGPWEIVSTKDGVVTVKAPVLLEDEHVKPRKRTAPKTAAKKTSPRRK